MPGARAFSLAASRADGGVYCGADGAFVGDVPLLKRSGVGGAWSVRSLAELNDELTAQYRLPIDITGKANALALIAHAFNRGDLAMAAIATVQMQLPDPPPLKSTEAHGQTAHRAAELHRIGLLKFWDSLKHPRTGTPPNPGWFAPVSDAEAATVLPVVDPYDPLSNPLLGPFGGGGGGGGRLRPSQAKPAPTPREAPPNPTAPAEAQPNTSGASVVRPSPNSTLPASPSQLGHIFRDEGGHLPDTPANRQLLDDVANDAGAILGTDRYGTVWSGKIQPDGTQVWTQSRNGQIINGGLNQTPHTFDPETGLSAPKPPGMSKQGIQMATLTDKQAYAAMFYFLDQLYERTKSDDLAGYLGAMSLLADGQTADPAMALDWQKAVEYALKGGEAGYLKLTPVKR